MSTATTPIRVLSDFTEEYKSYVVSQGRKVIQQTVEEGTGSVTLAVPENAEYLMFKNIDAADASLQFIDESFSTVSSRVRCPKEESVSLKIPETSVFVLAVFAGSGQVEFIVT